jgi:hypothetical protein
MLVLVRSRAAAATRLSWPGPGVSRRFGWFRALARLSLVTAALSMLSGCLVDDPPPYVPPRQTPPRLDYSSALPGLDQVIVSKSNEVIDFRMPVTSEDAGDDLSAVLLLDYRGDGTGFDPLYFLSLRASTLDDTKRVFKMPWTVRSPLAAGCHRITLRVTHSRNVGERADQVIDKADLAEAFWFANINVDPEDANSLVDCPQASIGVVQP